MLEVLQIQRTKVPHRRTDAAAHEIVNGLGHNDAAGRRVLLKPGGEIHAIAEHVEIGRNDVADMHCDTQHDRW